MTIIRATALLIATNKLTDAGYIVFDSPIDASVEELSIDSDGLLYENLVKKAMKKNPVLFQIDKKIMQEAESDFLHTDDLKGLIKEAVEVLKNYAE